MTNTCRKSTHTIRPACARDWRGIWTLLAPVFAQGSTYAYPPDISEDEARAVWMEKPQATFVGLDEGERIVATYYLTPNQPGQGAHVANCGYVVAAHARRRGWAGAMCEHSQREAQTRGFRAMQYNLVAATNAGAARLWQQHGFEVVGRLPGAFCHPEAGDVDALVMYKRLGRAAPGKKRSGENSAQSHEPAET